MRLPAGRPRRIALGVLVLALAGVATLVLWPDAPPRQREYLDVTACLLTDQEGVKGEQAKPVWAAMQDASVSSLVRVQHLQVNGPQTADNARAHANSLAGSRCGVVIAVGPAQVNAVVDVAPTYPAVRFVTVGGGASSSNVSVIADTSTQELGTAIRGQFDALVDTTS